MTLRPGEERPMPQPSPMPLRGKSRMKTKLLLGQRWRGLIIRFSWSLSRVLWCQLAGCWTGDLPKISRMFERDDGGYFTLVDEATEAERLPEGSLNV